MCRRVDAAMQMDHLVERTGLVTLTTDDFFWEPWEVPYTVRRDAAARSKMLQEAISQTENYIVGGSLISWGEQWLSMFDLVVFLHVPKEIRMQRLVNRELERYGDIIYTDPERSRLSVNFTIGRPNTTSAISTEGISAFMRNG